MVEELLSAAATRPSDVFVRACVRYLGAVADEGPDWDVADLVAHALFRATGEDFGRHGAWWCPSPETDDGAAASVRASVRACQKAFHALDLTTALAACDAAVEHDGRHADAITSRGWVQLELGRLDEADLDARHSLDLGADSTDEIAAAFELAMAVATVRGDLPAARRLAQEAIRRAPRATATIRARVRLLDGQPPSQAWVGYVAPRHFCWRRKGEAAAASYLLRRGVSSPTAFTTALDALGAARRARFERLGLARCPFPPVAGGGVTALRHVRLRSPGVHVLDIADPGAPTELGLAQFRAPAARLTHHASNGTQVATSTAYAASTAPMSEHSYAAFGPSAVKLIAES